MNKNWRILPDTKKRNQKIIKLYKQGMKISQLAKLFHLWHSNISIIVNPEMRSKHNKRQIRYQNIWGKSKKAYLEKKRQASLICNNRRYDVCPTFRKKVNEYSRNYQRKRRELNA